MVGIDIKPSISVRNLGVIIDQDLSLKEQVNAICRTCYGHLRSVIQIRPYMTTPAAHTIIQSLISSRLVYYNCLLAELPQYLIHKLQKVQNWAARIVLNVKKYDSISFHLHHLNWLHTFSDQILNKSTSIQEFERTGTIIFDINAYVPATPMHHKIVKKIIHATGKKTKTSLYG